MLPEAVQTSTSREMTQEFLGYNHNLRIKDNQFYDTKNLTADDYPVLSPRKQRGYFRTIPSINGLFATDKLAWVSGKNFYYDNTYKFEVTDTAKTFIAMGAYLIIFPDKIAYNTYTDEAIPMEIEFETVGIVNYTLCKIDGVNYESYYTGPTSPDIGTYTIWYDTSATPNVLKIYNENSAEWVSVPTTYVKIAATGIGTNFSVYDAVTIDNSTDTQFNGDMIIYAKDNDFIVVAAIISAAFSQDSALHPMTLSRTVPDMDFVTESENRIWGCSSANHEIYACKLGDPLNWRCYMGLSSDSYSATIGSPGDFTGAITHAGYVCFFKENILHRAYGTEPSNYVVTNVSCRGVEKGSSNSLAIINEILYYKSKSGVCAYDGSLPYEISNDLGENEYSSAVSGTLHNKYYISMMDIDYLYHLFVYDTVKKIWMQEDNTHVMYFTSFNGGLYYVDENSYLMVINNERMFVKLFPGMDSDLYSYPSNNLYPNRINPGTLEGFMTFIYPSDSTFPSSTQYSGTIKEIDWLAETGDIGISSPDNKYISKITIRLLLEEAAKFIVQAKYDTSEEWEDLIEITAAIKKSYTVPIVIRRCDFMKLRFSGIGMCKLYSRSFTIEEGSEL